MVLEESRIIRMGEQADDDKVVLADSETVIV